MSNSVDKILSILNLMQLAQLEANVRLSKLESKVNMLEADQGTIVSILDKIASSQVGLFEKADRLEAKLIKIEAGQTYVNRKMDALAVEDAKILSCVNSLQNDYREQLKRLSEEIENLSGITKENVFTIAKLKHNST